MISSSLTGKQALSKREIASYSLVFMDLIQDQRTSRPAFRHLDPLLQEDDKTGRRFALREAVVKRPIGECR